MATLTVATLTVATLTVATLTVAIRTVATLTAQCGAGFKRCIGAYDPDMVVSLHPLCQNLPLKVAFPGYHPRTSPAPPASHSPHPLSLPELAARGGVPWLSPPLEVAAAPGCTARAVHAVLCMHALHRALHRAPAPCPCTVPCTVHLHRAPERVTLGGSPLGGWQSLHATCSPPQLVDIYMACQVMDTVTLP